jgi:hypothetical protein
MNVKNNINTISSVGKLYEHKSLSEMMLIYLENNNKLILKYNALPKKSNKTIIRFAKCIDLSEVPLAIPQKVLELMKIKNTSTDSDNLFFDQIFNQEQKQIEKSIRLVILKRLVLQENFSLYLKKNNE